MDQILEIFLSPTFKRVFANIRGVLGSSCTFFPHIRLVDDYTAANRFNKNRRPSLLLGKVPTSHNISSYLKACQPLILVVGMNSVTHPGVKILKN